MKSQCPEYFIRTEWIIMVRVTSLTASYYPLRTIRRKNAAITRQRCDYNCYGGGQRTNSGGSEAVPRGGGGGIRLWLVRAAAPVVIVGWAKAGVEPAAPPTQHLYGHLVSRSGYRSSYLTTCTGLMFGSHPHGRQRRVEFFPPSKANRDHRTAAAIN